VGAGPPAGCAGTGVAADEVARRAPASARDHLNRRRLAADAADLDPHLVVRLLINNPTTWLC
jgi:hypothetical protein